MKSCNVLSIATACSLAICLTMGNPTVQAHGIFKKTLEKEVEGLRVTCYACHVKKEPKTVRNEFGELFYQEFKEEEFSKRWDELEQDREARKEFENEEMAPAFRKAMKKIGEKETEEGEKYIDLIKAGKIEGTKLKKKKK